MDERSKLLSNALGFMFPLIIIFGVYMILNGHLSPGGGFQGGTILASVFICRYLIDPADTISLKKDTSRRKDRIVFYYFLGSWICGHFLKRTNGSYACVLLLYHELFDRIGSRMRHDDLVLQVRTV